MTTPLIRYVFILSILIPLAHRLSAQGQEESIGETVDRISYTWDTESIALEKYSTLRKFCQDAGYRKSVFELLNEIHHYDSVLYHQAKLAQARSSNKEINKLLKEIEGFEEKYSPKSFIHFLKQECDSQKELEKNKKDLNTASGEESLDAQIYVIEVELHRFIKHLTKRIDHIRKHIHHLHIK